MRSRRRQRHTERNTTAYIQNWIQQREDDTFDPAGCCRRPGALEMITGQNLTEPEERSAYR
jgi:hypothetical protein